MGKVSIEVLKMSSRATQHIATQQHIATLTIPAEKIPRRRGDSSA
jgi:hypothetical protein